MKTPPRPANRLLLAALLAMLLAAAACSRLRPTPDTAYLTPIPQTTLDAYEYGQPITTQTQAVIAARNSFGFRMSLISEPEVIYAEKMTYKEAIQQLDESWQITVGAPPEKAAWLVVLNADWEFSGPVIKDVTDNITYYTGCGYVVLTADTGSLMFAGKQPCEKFFHEP